MEFKRPEPQLAEFSSQVDYSPQRFYQTPNHRPDGNNLTALLLDLPSEFLNESGRDGMRARLTQLHGGVSTHEVEANPGTWENDLYYYPSQGLDRESWYWKVAPDTIYICMQGLDMPGENKTTCVVLQRQEEGWLDLTKESHAPVGSYTPKIDTKQKRLHITSNYHPPNQETWQWKDGRFERLEESD